MTSEDRDLRVDDASPRRERPRPDRPRRRRRKSRFLLKILLVILVIFLIDLYRRINTAFEEMYEPFGDSVVDVRDSNFTLGRSSFSILILGTDGGRTDSMMVATINPRAGTTYLLSIARDTMVTIPGWGTTRINHAYAYGGLDLAVNTVQDLLNIPIDYHVTIGMEEFHILIDAFGGVTVYNDTVAFALGGYDFPLGRVELSGSAAYYYVRMRMDDPRGDFGRQERQRDVMNAMAQEAMSFTMVRRYPQVLNSIGGHMTTNVTGGNMLVIALRYNRALRNITNLDLQAPGQIINGMYLIPIPDWQLQEMTQRLRTHLELD